MKISSLTPYNSAYPRLLATIATPPAELFYLSQTPPEEFWQRPKVAIVGSRKVSAYGRSVTHKLAFELARAGVVIISGLALGVDAIAHRAALEAGGLTIAVLPSSIEKIYPASHHNLARQIVQQHGALITEYTAGSIMAFKSNFIARNRIVSGLSDGLLITEAAEKSGTLHTARFALEQGREVLVVPGNITSPTSAGTNNLIKSGASVVTSADDVLFALGVSQSLERTSGTIQGANEQEQAILDALISGITDADELLIKSHLDAITFGQSLTMLEICGKIRPLGNNQWAIS